MFYVATVLRFCRYQFITKLHMPHITTVSATDWSATVTTTKLLAAHASQSRAADHASPLAATEPSAWTANGSATMPFTQRRFQPPTSRTHSRRPATAEFTLLPTTTAAQLPNRGHPPFAQRIWTQLSPSNHQPFPLIQGMSYLFIVCFNMVVCCYQVQKKKMEQWRRKRRKEEGKEGVERVIWKEEG